MSLAGKQVEAGAGAAEASIGAVIRARRLKLGMSLSDLAARVGCAKSYLSALENERRGAPSDEMAVAIEMSLQLERGTLLETARWRRGLSAGGESVRRALERMQAQESAAKKLSALLNGAKGSKALDAVYRSGALKGLVEEIAGNGGKSPDRADKACAGLVPVPLGREVPLINKVAAGYPREFTDLGYPARVADEYVRTPDVDDPDAFAARVVGDSMTPEYAEGDVVIFSPSTPVHSGMDCFARLEPDQEATFKRVYFETSSSGEELIRLQPLNGAYPVRVVGREQVGGLYAAVSVLRKIVR